MVYKKIVGTLRTYGSFALCQLDAIVDGKERSLKRDYLAEILDELDRATPKSEMVQNDFDWLSMLRPALRTQTERGYERFDERFREDYRTAVSNLRSVQTFPLESLNPEIVRISREFLVCLINQALKQDVSYKRYVA